MNKKGQVLLGVIMSLLMLGIILLGILYAIQDIKLNAICDELVGENNSYYTNINYENGYAGCCVYNYEDHVRVDDICITIQSEEQE